MFILWIVLFVFWLFFTITVLNANFILATLIPGGYLFVLKNGNFKK